MRNFILGLILGMTLVGVAWAAQALTLEDGSGNEIGTSANPIYITS